VPLEHFTVEDGLGCFRPTGPTTAEAFTGLLGKAMAECKAARLRGLLVNGTGLTHPPVTTTDRYTIGTTVVASGDVSLKVAFVGREDQLDPQQFGALVARNRGFQVETFETEDEALLWLNA
jgi:hypothetical protein